MADSSEEGVLVGERDAMTSETENRSSSTLHKDERQNATLRGHVIVGYYSLAFKWRLIPLIISSASLSIRPTSSSQLGMSRISPAANPKLQIP